MGESELIATPLAAVSARNGSVASTSQSSSSLLPMHIVGTENISGLTVSPHGVSIEERVEVPEAVGIGGREAGSQRYDFQQLARWIEQALPFTILLLMVLIRQHLQGLYSISLPTTLTGSDRLVCCHGHGQGQDCIVEHLKSVSVFCVVCMSGKIQTFVGKITM